MFILLKCHLVSSEKAFKLFDTQGKLEKSFMTIFADGQQDNCRYRADSKFAPSQWETSLQSNALSHWLGTNLESALQGQSWGKFGLHINIDIYACVVIYICQQ